MQSQSKFHGHPSQREKKNLKVDVESEKIKERQNNPDQKEFDRRHHHFQYQAKPQSHSNKTAWDISWNGGLKRKSTQLQPPHI